VASNGKAVPDVLYTSDIAITRRGDAGHTLAITGRGRVDPTPQLIRFSTQFLPMFVRRWRSLAPGGMEGIRSGHEGWSRWRLDRQTPMERMRILDPLVDRQQVQLTYERAMELIPELEGSPITAAWSGYVDSTPDGVPGIGAISSIPGFVLAAGFSGHGFGIGPGAGHLVADIVTGEAPIVEAGPEKTPPGGGFSGGKVARMILVRRDLRDGSSGDRSGSSCQMTARLW
jgi:glycine/D-amino acid oxidase-like deaminating enzyme